MTARTHLFERRELEFLSWPPNKTKQTWCTFNNPETKTIPKTTFPEKTFFYLSVHISIDCKIYTENLLSMQILRNTWCWRSFGGRSKILSKLRTMSSKVFRSAWPITVKVRDIGTRRNVFEKKVKNDVWMRKLRNAKSPQKFRNKLQIERFAVSPRREPSFIWWPYPTFEKQFHAAHNPLFWADFDFKKIWTKNNLLTDWAHLLLPHLSDGIHLKSTRF